MQLSEKTTARSAGSEACVRLSSVGEVSVGGSVKQEENTRQVPIGVNFSERNNGNTWSKGRPCFGADGCGNHDHLNMFNKPLQRNVNPLQYAIAKVWITD